MRLVLVLSIVATAFLSEDGGAAAAATLVGSSTLALPLALSGAVAGLWVGDIAIYAVARRFGRRLLERSWTRRFFPHDILARAERWMGGRGSAALFATRFVPGTRVPAYVAAGLGGMTFARFALTTALSAAAWSLMILVLGRALARAFPLVPHWVVGLTFVFLFLAVLATWRKLGARIAAGLSVLTIRIRRWEFWPAWLFYAPVPLMCAWLGIRHGGLSLPTAANPSQHNGGIVGESKIAILEVLQRVAPDRVAHAYLVPPGETAERFGRIREMLDEGRLLLPFVLKPDTAQRGEGFRKIGALADAREYLARVAAPVVAQAYIEGPHEAGLFYYRFPGERRGEIFAITEKRFPEVVGDGERTVRELINADPRARLIARIYLRRLGDLACRVLPAGETLRLVEAGNHCQGCIFRDGSTLDSEQLRAVIDEISQGLPGFFIGRYDVRYASPDDLRAGRFTILELNGAASEATNIYDERNSVWSAYCTLYRQWELVYAIGAANRRRGSRSARLFDLWRDWKRYQRMAAAYPMAD